MKDNENLVLIYFLEKKISGKYKTINFLDLIKRIGMTTADHAYLCALS